jgi:pilus assembly protein CpaB
MNKRLLSVLAFALLVSVAASLVLYKVISSKLTANAKLPSTQLVVASHELGVGTLIKESDFKAVDWSAPQPKGGIANPADVIGRGVVVTINEGEPIVESRIAARGAGAGLAATIPSGMRAVAVRVNDVVGVAGFVLPGMRVDLLIAGNPPGGAAGNLGTLEKTLLQNIQVLSAGQNIQKDAEGKPVSVPVVNLLVTPEQAETLSLASSETRIQLVLRNPMDRETVKTPGTAVANLFSGQTGPLPRPAPRAIKPKPATLAVVQTAPLPPPAVQEPPKTIAPLFVEVITGINRSEVKVAPPRPGTGNNGPATFEVAPLPAATMPAQQATRPPPARGEIK